MNPAGRVGGILCEGGGGIYPCWWLPPEGVAVSCNSHVHGGGEILRLLGIIVPLRGDTVYDQLFARGYCRVMFHKGGVEEGFHFNCGESGLTLDQKKWLRGMGRESGVPVWDDSKGSIRQRWN